MNPRLAELVAEAERLAARHDGVHDMLQACAIVRGYAGLDPVDVDRIEQIVTRMRVYNRRRVYPKDYAPYPGPS